MVITPCEGGGENEPAEIICILNQKERGVGWGNNERLLLFSC